MPDPQPLIVEIDGLRRELEQAKAECGTAERDHANALRDWNEAERGWTVERRDAAVALDEKDIELEQAQADAAAFVNGIPTALGDYCCQCWQYDDEMGGMALVDVFSAAGDKADISEGKAELELLADHLQSYQPNPGRFLLDRLAAAEALVAAFNDNALADRADEEAEAKNMDRVETFRRLVREAAEEK